jgi:hypothetical protein
VRRSWDADKLKLCSDSGDSGSKKCKRSCGGAYGWSGRSASGGSLQSGVRRLVYVGACGRNLVSVTAKTFPHLTYFIKKIDKFCTFSSSCEDNPAINCITVQHKESFPSTFTGHALVIIQFTHEEP